MDSPDHHATTATEPPPPTDAYAHRALADRLGDEIAEADALATAATHTTLTKLREFIKAGLWNEHGARSAAEWCSLRLGWGRSTARAKVRVAERLGDLPLIDDAFRRGLISYSVVRLLVCIAAPETEAHLLRLAQECTGNLLARIVGHINRIMRTTENPNLEDLLDLTFRNSDRGTVRMIADLPPEGARMVINAVERELRRLRKHVETTEPAPVAPPTPPAAPASPVTEPPADEDAEFLSAMLREADAEASLERPLRPLPYTDPDAPPEDGLAREEWAHQRFLENQRDNDQRRVDRVQAFMNIFERALHDDRPTRAIPGAVEALVVVDYATLASATNFPIGRCELSDGTPISPEAARRLTCDSPVSAAIVAPDGSPLDVGRKTRQISDAMWKALLLRDRHCTFPGCDRDIHLNAHHIQHWAQGGPTSLDNLTLTCRAHHRLVHDGGYSVLRLDAKTVVYFDPQGEPVVGPIRREFRGDAQQRIREQLRAQGIEIDASVKHAKVAGLREADMCATVGYVLESTPGSPFYRTRPGTSEVTSASAAGS